MSHYLEQRRLQKLGIKPTDQQLRAEKKQTPIAKVSPKRKVEDKEYKVASKEYIKNHPICEAQIATDCTGKSKDIHHKKGRNSKDDRVNPENFLAVCRNCHLYLHAHPVQAKELGLSESRINSKK